MTALEAAAPGRPTRAVVVLLDSLNRQLLGAYGGREFETPNLDRLAARSVRFDRHYVGSLPCMPARHDLLCGALDFLWKPWGSIELWEEPITVPLRRAGVVTKLVSDHPHLFETGGENYHCDFTAWDYQRGHESDPWRTRPDPSFLGAPEFVTIHAPYERSRGFFRDESDFPGPRTLTAAARWLAEDAPHHERFLLFVDEFDPHEPFDTPEPWASRYDPDWEGPHLVWPPYVAGGVAKGVLTPRQARQIRAQYGAKLSMIDAWLGRVLDAMDRGDLWRDTAFFLLTDHGHYLGEKDVFGKPGVPVYETLGHIPLLVSWPGVAPGACDALTTSVDVHATLLDLFDVTTRQRTHGRSLAPLLTGAATSVRDWALAGVWGRQVHVVASGIGSASRGAGGGDADCFKYARGPTGANEPLVLLSNRWSTMPIHRLPDLRLPLPDERATLGRMPGSTVPVLRQPFAAGDFVPYWAGGVTPGNLLFDLANDPDEERDLCGSPHEKRAEELLRTALLALEAPPEQLARLGLA